ncbi:MAG TPA: hypothetical protein VGI64_03395 [Streptosporangiaceae bacterium]
MRITRDSILWPAAAAVLFTLAVLLFTPLRLSLLWDEAVYASQIAQHSPKLLWSAERYRGMPLLVAPVTLVTGSVLVLRVYLTVLGGVALFLALLAWRGLRPGWVLGLAGLIFGGLWAAETWASELYPNMWVALAALAAVGLFLQAARDTPRRKWILVALAATVAFAALMRLPDTALVCVPLVIGALAVRQWRSLATLAALLTGLVIGAGDWLIESYRYFDGPIARLQQTSHDSGGSHFSPLLSLRILSGGRASSSSIFPGISSYSHPVLLLWWAAFLALAIIGVIASRRQAGWPAALLPVICAVLIYGLYTFPVRDNPRYLLTAWALLAIPVADGAAWLMTGLRSSELRLAAGTLVAAFLAIELVTQHAILNGEVKQTKATSRITVRASRALDTMGVRAPCLITTPGRPAFAPSSEPTAFRLNCAYKYNLKGLPSAKGMRVVLFTTGLRRLPRYARTWTPHRLPVSGNVVAYIQP